MKYIDADKLKELIDEKWKELADKNVKIGGGKWDAEISTYLSVLRLIDSLQQEQPEVDLEKITKYSRIKELPDGFEKEWLCYYHKNPEYNSAKFSHLSLIEREYIIAHHFYELARQKYKIMNL